MATFHYIVILLIFNVVNCSNTNNDQLDKTADFIPILNTSGSHYQIGFDIGFTFQHIIKDFLNNYDTLTRFEKAAKTTQGKKNYINCLEVTEMFFPQYIIELKGIAIGADVPFEKLFLIHMNELIMTNNKKNDVGGYSESYDESETRHFENSTILVNSSNKRMIGSNVDVRKKTKNHYYIVNAHIIPTDHERSGIFSTQEEKWSSLTYAGMLSGYMGGYNYHGLVYTVNTIYTKALFPEKIPRVFLTRALLASKADLTEITELLKNSCVGTAEAFTVIFGFINIKDSNLLFKMEVDPRTFMSISEIKTKTIYNVTPSLFYTNRVIYIQPISELKTIEGWKACEVREKQHDNLNIKFTTSNDVTRLLGNNFSQSCQIYRDTDNDPLHTMITMVFDFDNKTWTIWTKNPNISSPVLVLSLEFIVALNNPTWYIN